MKGSVVFLATVLSWLTASAQVGSDFRIANGRLYNVQNSVLWQDIPPKNTILGSGGSTVYAGTVCSVRKGVVAVQILVEEENGARKKNDWDGKLLLIKNHPKRDNLRAGDLFPRDRFLFIGDGVFTNSVGATVPARVYDYGLPNTPENRRTLTNSPPRG